MKRVLFIDDDQDYLEANKVFFEKKYEVLTALSAEEGWKKIKEEKPDLIILDAMMEPKNGFVLSRELKANTDYRNIPIIMLTAMVPRINDTKYSPDDILRYNGEEFIEKSEGMEVIQKTMEKYLNE